MVVFYTFCNILKDFCAWLAANSEVLAEVEGGYLFTGVCWLGDPTGSHKTPFYPYKSTFRDSKIPKFSPAALTSSRIQLRSPAEVEGGYLFKGRVSFHGNPLMGFLVDFLPPRSSGLW